LSSTFSKQACLLEVEPVKEAQNKKKERNKNFFLLLLFSFPTKTITSMIGDLVGKFE
jgi:hypothetical protein